MSALEANFKKRLVVGLKKLGVFCQTIETSTGRGVPDLWICNQGQSLWIECKAPAANKITIRPEQRNWMLDVNIIRKVSVFILAEHQNDKKISLSCPEMYMANKSTHKKDLGLFNNIKDICSYLCLYLKA